MRYLKLFLFLACFNSLHAQQYELNEGWQCINIKKIKDNGEKISQPSFKLQRLHKSHRPWNSSYHDAEQQNDP